MDVLEFEQACWENREALLAYAFTCCRDLDLAEDIVQEALLIAFEKRDKYFSDADMGAWLISITRNVWYRERKRRKLHSLTTEFLERNASLLFDAETYSADRLQRRRRALAECLQKLHQIDQQIIQSHFEGNLKYREIALRVERTLSAVKVRMARARMALRDCVRRSLSFP